MVHSSFVKHYYHLQATNSRLTPAPMTNGRPTPYQAFGALFDRIKNVTDGHGRHPYVARTLSRRDKELSLKILNLVRADGEPSAHEIDKTKRAAFKVVHPDLLMGRLNSSPIPRASRSA